MKTIEQRALGWVVSDDTGSSSKAIFKHMMNLPGAKYDYPSDPSDLGRCLRLLDLIPEWKSRIHEMAQYSPGWAGQVAVWDDLAAIMADEVGIDWSKGRSALATYKAMKLAQADGYRNDLRYVCTFYKDGTLSSAWKKETGQ